MTEIEQKTIDSPWWLWKSKQKGWNVIYTMSEYFKPDQLKKNGEPRKGAKPSGNFVCSIESEILGEAIVMQHNWFLRKEEPEKLKKHIELYIESKLHDTLYALGVLSKESEKKEIADSEARGYKMLDLANKGNFSALIPELRAHLHAAGASKEEFDKVTEFENLCDPKSEDSKQAAWVLARNVYRLKRMKNETS